MSSRDEQNREHSRPARWEGEAPGQPQPQERDPVWTPDHGASGYGSPWDRRAQGRSTPGQEAARWDQSRSDTLHRAGQANRRSNPASPSGWSRLEDMAERLSGELSSTHSAGWGRHPGGDLGSGFEPGSQGVFYGSGQGERSAQQDWPVAWGGRSGTGYGPAGPGHSGYGQEEAWRFSPFFHDHDYRQWRQEQLRKLDSEYLAWRQERYRKFADDFNAWRSHRAPDTATAAPAAGDDATGTGPPGADDASLTPSKPK